MKLFIDTAIVEDIKVASTWGIIDGVTTNPSLIALAGRDIKEVIDEILALVDGPISAEVPEGNAEDMVKLAREFAKWHKNVVIKLPMTLEGVKATKILTKENIKTNVTLVFSISQALMAAKAGATYVSPFMGRLDALLDDENAGYKLIKEIKDVFNIYGFKTQIIAASVRSTKHVEQAALAGSDIATIPYKVLLSMAEHQLTSDGLRIFREASKK